MIFETSNSKDALIFLLSRVRSRMRFSIFYRNFTFYSLWAISFFGMVIFASKFVPLRLPIYLSAFVCVFAALVVALAKTLSRRLTLHDVALTLDANFDLKERFSTALELVDEKRISELSSLQVNDAAEVAKSLNPKSAHPYSLPKSAKFMLIAFLFVVASLVMPRFYELPPQPTDAELAVMQGAVDKLENIDARLSGKSAKDLRKAVNALKGEDVRKAQKQLASLRSLLSAQRDELAKPDLLETIDAIEEATKDSKLLPDGRPDGLAKELDKLAENLKKDQIPPELKKELEETLKNLLAQLDGLIAPKELVEELRKIESEPLSPEMLERMAQHFKKLAERARKFKGMTEMLAQLQESQKKIGLAGLDLKQNDGVAKGDGSPGEGTMEGQGERVDADVTAHKDRDDTLELTAPQSSDGGSSTVNTTEEPDIGRQTNVSYQQAYLSAKQAMEAAVQNDSIPVRYRSQVRNYFSAIASEQ